MCSKIPGVFGASATDAADLPRGSKSHSAFEPAGRSNAPMLICDLCGLPIPAGTAKFDRCKTASGGKEGRGGLATLHADCYRDKQLLDMFGGF